MRCMSSHHTLALPRTTLIPYLAGVGVLLLVFTVYRADAAMDAMRVAITRDIQRVVHAAFPPQSATRMLNVPFHRQEHALSCEIASLRSALLTTGLDVPESMLLSAMPVDSTPKTVDANGNITWGDPNIGFVGNIDGRMPSTGLGIHAPALKQVAQLYSVVHDIKANDAAALTAAIDRGNPVIVWSALGTSPRRLTWKTPTGTTVNTALYEHTLVVAGYKGSAAAIESVFVVDPLTGMREESWKEFTWRTSFLDHQALEIDPVRF
jgi:uncharacterized protein YvpB